MMASKEMEWNCVTADIDGHDLRFSFTFKNFLDYVCEPGESFETPRMECTRKCGVKWVLEVKPYGPSKKDKDYIGVYLKLVTKPSHSELVTARYAFSLIGQGGRQVKIAKALNVLEDNLKLGYGYIAFITRTEIQNNQDLYLPDGNLTIRCQGKAFVNKPSRTLQIENIPDVVPASSNFTSSTVLKNVYEGEICSDVVLKTGSSEFKCHKNILSATCNYFKAMFQHDMKENRENVVNLSKDLNEDELKAILDFIYLGKRDFSKLPQASAQNLYRVSDMYEIEGLQEACESELIKQLNKDNVRELIVFAITYCAKGLERAAAKIFSKESN